MTLKMLGVSEARSRSVGVLFGPARTRNLPSQDESAHVKRSPTKVRRLDPRSCLLLAALGSVLTSRMINALKTRPTTRTDSMVAEREQYS